MNEFLFEITFKQATFQFRVNVLFKSFSPSIYLCEFLCNIKWLGLSGTTKVEKNMQKHQVNVDLLTWWQASCVAEFWYIAKTQIHVHRYFIAAPIIVPIANSNQCEARLSALACIKIGITEFGLWWYKRNKTLQEKTSQCKELFLWFSVTCCMLYICYWQNVSMLQ